MLRLATLQHPTSPDVDANARHLSSLMEQAASAGAHLVHTCEGALSGYAPFDFASPETVDFDLVEARARELFAKAGELGVWLVLGAMHRLTPPHRPHNSVYVANDRGELVDRYDKRFCAGPSDGQGELALYSPGDHPVDFTVNGVRCTIHVCHEYRYPELVRTAKQRGVDLVLHSFHAANQSDEAMAENEAYVGDSAAGATLPEITMPASLIAAAASSHVFVSGANSCARRSHFGSFFVRADGVMTGQLERHSPGVLLSDVDPSADLYDSTKAWRARAMDGRLHSGSIVDDPRSSDRRSL